MSVWLQLAVPGSMIEAPGFNGEEREIEDVAMSPPFALARLKTRFGRQLVWLQYASMADGLKSLKPIEGGRAA
jgi:hypothetical protein